MSSDLPRLLAYPRETVVSEKLEAMVKLGIANSRMKDFHDLHSLSITFEFDGKTLTEAVRATFKQRGTELPAGGVPLAFTPEFYEDENKVKQWSAFCNKNKSYVPQNEIQKNVVAHLASFLVPVIKSVQQERALDSAWTPSHAWQPRPPAITGNRKDHRKPNFVGECFPVFPLCIDEGSFCSMLNHERGTDTITCEALRETHGQVLREQLNTCG